MQSYTGTSGSVRPHRSAPVDLRQWWLRVFHTTDGLLDSDGSCIAVRPLPRSLVRHAVPIMLVLQLPDGRMLIGPVVITVAQGRHARFIGAGAWQVPP